MLKEKLSFIKEILVCAYLWQLPFSWRFIIDPNRGQVNGNFNEYMDISLYFGELLIVIALAIHILEYIINKKSILSNKKMDRQWNYMFHMEHIVLVTLVGLLVLNIVLSIDPILSIFTAFHWAILIIFLYLFKEVYVSRGTKFIESIILILFFGIPNQIK